MKTEQQSLQKITKPTLPIFAKIIIKNASDTRIPMLNDYTHMKSIIDQLPCLAELKHDPDMLVKLMG